MTKGMAGLYQVPLSSTLRAFHAGAPVLFLGHRLEGGMSAALRLREDYGAPALRALARASRDADQTRRLLALAAIYEGASRGAAAAIGGGQRKTGAGWVGAFNAHGQAGLIGGKAPGQRPLLGPEQRAALRRIVEAGP